MNDYPKYFKVPVQSLYVKVVDRYKIIMFRSMHTANGIENSVVKSSTSAVLTAFMEDSAKVSTAEEFNEKFLEFKKTINDLTI